jgi:hypothetical protein
MRIQGAKDFWGGLVFVFFGLMALLISRDYPIGTTMHMGPRYFPTIIGSLLTLLGLIIAVRGLSITGEKIKGWGPRPLVMVLAAVVAFAVMIRPLGLASATLALVAISCLGTAESRIREVVVLYLFLAALAVGLFIYGIGLPLKVWPL